MKKRFLTLLVLVSILIQSCAKTNSDNIKTSGFYAEYSVSVDSSSPTVAKCVASFRVESGGTFIDLTTGDTVTCNGQAMSRSEIAGMVSYTVNLTGTVGATYTVLLTRSGESPYSATVTLPDPITTISPVNGASASKGAGLSFSWTPSSNASDAMLVSTTSVTGGDTNCPYSASYSNPAPESGVGSFSAMQMALPTATGTAGACSLKVSWQRQRPGTMPSGLKGSVTAVQNTSVGITLN